jgi:hypothetical protein
MCAGLSETGAKRPETRSFHPGLSIFVTAVGPGGWRLGAGGRQLGPVLHRGYMCANKPTTAYGLLLGLLGNPNNTSPWPPNSLGGGGVVHRSQPVTACDPSAEITMSVLVSGPRVRQTGGCYLQFNAPPVLHRPSPTTCHAKSTSWLFGAAPGAGQTMASVSTTTPRRPICR